MLSFLLLCCDKEDKLVKIKIALHCILSSGSSTKTIYIIYKYELHSAYSYITVNICTVFQGFTSKCVFYCKYNLIYGNIHLKSK